MSEIDLERLAFDKVMEKSRSFYWSVLNVGDEIKVIEFQDYETEEGEMKYWMRIDSKDEETRMVTGPITFIGCGNEYINEGQIVTRSGESYLTHAPGGLK